MEEYEFSREIELKKMMEFLESEQRHYKKELEKNPDYKIVYYEKRGLYI